MHNALTQLTEAPKAGPDRLDRLALKRLVSCISEIRRLHPEIQSQTIHLLLEVAIQPDITMSELIRKTNLSQASCSHNVSLLSNRDRDNKPGLGLVESREDPAERRRRIVKLTQKGQELMASLADLIR